MRTFAGATVLDVQVELMKTRPVNRVLALMRLFRGGNGRGDGLQRKPFTPRLAESACAAAICAATELHLDGDAADDRAGRHTGTIRQASG